MTAPQPEAAEFDLESAREWQSDRGGTHVVDPDGATCVYNFVSTIGRLKLKFSTRWLKGVQQSIRYSLEDGEPLAANDNDPPPFINPVDWQGMPVPTREWFLDGLIPRRQITILNGDGGVGKSLLALQIAAASAMGCETVGLRPMTGRVMYLGAEDESDEFHRRLAAITYEHQRSLSDMSDFRLLPMAGRDALLARSEQG
ncbi:AAA family ATPase [Mesorhizobium sp. M0991]|uniref:AAA family ATPase n=1 Tax=Mesorhizobium sp. M0991 TaxID=2957043 RepID=UPI003335BB5C